MFIRILMILFALLSAVNLSFAQEPTPIPTTTPLPENRSIIAIGQADTLTLKPASAPSGLVDVHVQNKAHHDTSYQFVLVKTDLAADSLLVDRHGNVSLFRLHVYYTFDMLNPAMNQDVILYLQPGHYVLFANNSGMYSNGMYASLTVKAPDNMDVTPVPTPSKNSNVYYVTLTDSSIEMPHLIASGMELGALGVGPNVFSITNGGTKPHSFEIQGENHVWRLDNPLSPGETYLLNVTDLVPSTYKVFSPINHDREHGLNFKIIVNG